MTKVQVNKINSLTGHRNSIYTIEKSGEENVFYSGGGDGLVVSWDMNNPDTGKLVAQVPSSVYAVHYYGEENSLIIGQNFYGLHVIDLDTMKQKNTARFTSSSIFDFKVYDGKIVAATGDGTVAVLDYQNLKILKKIRPTIKSARTLAIFPDKSEMAVGFSDHMIRIYDCESFELKKEVQGHKNSVFALKYSPDFRFLLSAGRDANLKIWDVNNGYNLNQSIVAHIYAINDISYRQDGRYFVTASMDKTIKIWDANEFRLLKVVDNARHKGHISSVNKLFWSSHHDRLISCSDDRTISIWDFNIDNEI